MASSLFKITVVQHWVYDCWIDAAGLPCAKEMPGARFVKSRKVPAGTAGAKKVKNKSGKWYGRVPGNAKPVPLSANKVVALQMLSELIRKAELGRVDLNDPYEEHRPKPLAAHLADYRRELEARDNDPRYVELVIRRLSALCEGCGFCRLSDLSASRAVDWLAQLRRNEPSCELPPDVVQFTRSEAAEALGMTNTAFRDAVKRLGLPAHGKGPARRYPRSTVEGVRDQAGRGRSVQTTNYYLSHLKSFCRWLVRDRRVAESPVAHLEANNTEVDRRHDRRELNCEELRLLLTTARASSRTLLGFTGEDRYHLYAVACGTGFRAGALASLTPGHFDLNAQPPTVALAARRNKSRKARLQPLPADLADLLRIYLSGKAVDRPLWGGSWARKGEGAEMLRADLKEAGLPYRVEGHNGPLYADFHALRHSYITALGRSGVDLRTAQALAGHSTPTLTARYMHVRLHDLAGSVEKLPGFLQPDDGGRVERQALGATVTDAGLPPVCTGFAQTIDPGRDRMRPREASGSGKKPVEDDASNNPTNELRLAETDCDVLMGKGPSRIRTGDGGFAIRWPCVTRRRSAVGYDST